MTELDKWREAAEQWQLDQDNATLRNETAWQTAKRGFIAGAEWQATHHEPVANPASEDEVHVELIVAIEALESIAACKHLNPAKIAGDALKLITANALQVAPPSTPKGEKA